MRAPGEQARERVGREVAWVARDRDRPAAVDRVERDRRQADERVAEQRDPPGERIAAGLLHLRLVVGHARVRVGERADVREGAPHGRPLEAARIDAEAPAAALGLERQRLAVIEEIAVGAIAQSKSQSSRTARVMSRIAIRSSSIVGRPQYQSPAHAPWTVRSGNSVKAVGR